VEECIKLFYTMNEASEKEKGEELSKLKEEILSLKEKDEKNKKEGEDLVKWLHALPSTLAGGQKCVFMVTEKKGKPSTSKKELEPKKDEKPKKRKPEEEPDPTKKHKFEEEQEPRDKHGPENSINIEGDEESLEEMIENAEIDRVFEEHDNRINQNTSSIYVKPPSKLYEQGISDKDDEFIETESKNTKEVWTLLKVELEKEKPMVLRGSKTKRTRSVSIDGFYEIHYKTGRKDFVRDEVTKFFNGKSYNSVDFERVNYIKDKIEKLLRK
jgi:hypothetical protein